MVIYGISEHYMVNCGKPWFFSYIVYGNCMIYHGFPGSKHHGIPWFPWYIMVFYHGLPVLKHHDIFTMEYDGIFT